MVILLVACVLCAMVDEAAFCDEVDDDFDEAYDEDDFFTSSMTVSRAYARRRRSDGTTLNQLGTGTGRNEYEDTESDVVALKPLLPLTMLPVSPYSQKNSATPNNIIHLYPKFLSRPTNPNTDFTSIDHPTRSNKLTVDPKATETTVKRYLNIYPELLTRSTNLNTDLSTVIKYPSQYSNPDTDTASETISDISTFPTTDVFNSNVTSSNNLLFLSPVGFPLNSLAYRTQCVDCNNNGRRTGKYFDQILAQDVTIPTIPTIPAMTAPPLPLIDMPFLLKIIDNLTMQYDWNLTNRFNESLQKYKIPTCPDWTVTEGTTNNRFENASLISKCFVCGLKTPGIPYDSRCADAFSGDFIPLVPVDAQARASISRYRKYCRYLDVNGVEENPFEPHSLFGRFTGGCSVRWVDVTGVYTQRACRNRRRAVLGKHFGSKRMAKLEMALKDIDDGCMISPVASLLPLSRGISLYARFHVCVCTGSWCNRTAQIPAWTKNLTIPLMLVILKILS